VQRVLKDVDLQTRFHLWFKYDGALPYFLLAGQEFLNNVLIGQLIGRGRPIAWLARSWFESLRFLFLGSFKAYCLCQRRQWLPGLATTNTECILDDWYDTWNSIVGQTTIVQTSNILLWSSRWKLGAFPFSLQKAITWKPFFNNFMFIWSFFDVDSPSVVLAMNFAFILYIRMQNW
jgi:hypothetical protein